MTKAVEWTGQVGDIWAQEWRRTDRSVVNFAPHLNAAILAAAPAIGRAADVGCGAGQTSIMLAETRPQLTVIGLDVSDSLIAIARERGAALANLDFACGDAVALAERHAPIDLFVSRHGVMFFDDPVAAFAGLRRAASPGARLVFSCFRDWTLNAFYRDLANEIGVPPPESGAPGPFAFSDHDRVTAILRDAGWRDAAAEPVDFGYRVGEGADAIDDATSYLLHIGPAARLIRDASEADRPALRAGLRRVIERRVAGDRVDFPAAVWIWTAHA